LREGDHSENLRLNGRMLLKWNLKERLGGRGIHCSFSGHGEMAGCCERRNEFSGTIKRKGGGGGEAIACIAGSPKVIRKHSALWS
jgi:hypothetical protein